MSEPSIYDHADRIAIQELFANYAFGLDRRDFDRVASTFTDDADVKNLFDSYLPEGETFNSQTTGGRDVAEGARALFSNLDATQHLIGAQIIELASSNARAWTQIVARHHRGSSHYDTGGTYEDKLVRTDQGWRIAERLFRISWTAGSPDVFIPA